MSIFKFKHFQVKQSDSAMKIGTDAMIFGALIESHGKGNALDIGTGTGVLSMMVAQKNPGLQISAIEIEEKAAMEATENVRNSPFHSQIQVLQQDFLQFSPEKPFDLIFSNPPYFENSSRSGADERNFARHDDYLPLSLLFPKVASHLSKEGNFWLILPHSTMDQYYPQAMSCLLFPKVEIEIFGNEKQLVRKIAQFSTLETEKKMKRFVIRNLDGTYTDEYKELTSDYHFNVLR